MKVRTGFVSNSSSSSYVVAIKRLPQCKSCGRSDPDFLGLLENIQWSDRERTQLHARGMDSIINYIRVERFSWANDEEMAAWEGVFKEIDTLEKNGYDVGFIEVSYGDDVTHSMLEDFHARKVAKVLWSDHNDYLN